jgi:WbqC-like protein family
MKVAMMQPGFMPWQGLFELIYKSDCFIFLDDFQFSVQGWNQRNRLFVNKGQVGWYSVPMMKSISFKVPLCKTKINERIPWRVKAWKRIQQNYSKASYFGETAPSIEKWLLSSYQSLADQNVAFIKIVCGILKIQTEVRLSSQYTTSVHRSHKVLELLRWCNATQYLCAIGSFEYMKEDAVFPVDDIEILFQNFTPKPYTQVGTDEFIPFLSVLDALLNIGPDQTFELINNGTVKWLTWDDMMVNCHAKRNAAEEPEEVRQ